MQHDKQYGSDLGSHFPQLGVQELTTMHSNELGFTIPFTSFSLSRPASVDSASGNPSPAEGPSPPLSPVPGVLGGYTFTANTLATSLSEAVGDHQTQNNPSAALATMTGFSLDPATQPSHPPAKERLECDSDKGYGIHVQGEFINMPAPPTSITTHPHPHAPLGDMVPAMYSPGPAYTPVGLAYSATQSGPSTPGAEHAPVFSMGFDGQQQQQLTMPIAVPATGQQMPLSVDRGDMYVHYSAQAQTYSVSANDDDSEHDDEAGLTVQEVKRRRLRRKAELARLSRLSKKNRMSELEAENAMLREQLALIKQQQAQAHAGVDLGSLQTALQAISDSVAPALQMLATRSQVPQPAPLPGYSTFSQSQAQPASYSAPTQVYTHAPSEVMTRRRRASP